MKVNEEWLIFDVETTGLMLPIYTVEIAAQRMKGWEPAGEPFRILLNHDVDIEYEAEALHGYSREYLRKHGQDPIVAHKQFFEYAGNLPVVAYNISYDWNRVLEPEYLRLGVPKTGTRGFCAMTLSRRVIPETDNYRLETLKNHFNLTEAISHKGLNDVIAVVKLFQSIIKKRLEAANIIGFDNITTFSRKTPVIKCREEILKSTDIKPIQTITIKQTETIKQKKKPFVPVRVSEIQAYAKELIGFCEGIIADEILNEKEIISLYKWLTNCPFTHIYPMSAIADTVEKVYEDGIITNQEQAELITIINKVIMPNFNCHLPDNFKNNPIKIVESFDDPNISYKVNILDITCTCPNFEVDRASFHTNNPKRLCKHLIKVLIDNQYIPETLMSYKDDIIKMSLYESGFNIW